MPPPGLVLALEQPRLCAVLLRFGEQDPIGDPIQPPSCSQPPPISKATRGEAGGAGGCPITVPGPGPGGLTGSAHPSLPKAWAVENIRLLFPSLVSLFMSCNSFVCLQIKPFDTAIRAREGKGFIRCSCAADALQVHGLHLSQALGTAPGSAGATLAMSHPRSTGCRRDFWGESREKGAPGSWGTVRPVPPQPCPGELNHSRGREPSPAGGTR